ncbi:MAG: proline--tRNA ligase, partial [Candidatus Shapirobacteria bacterium]|nr:proline--tRNA ligase [Candidatus Shapirobacteria bacterium]
MFGKTTKTAPRGAKLTSHKFLFRGGFIRQSVAGYYYFLPLGWRVHKKIEALIRQEMNQSGAQEMLSPTLHPIELWQETNRTKAAAFELMTIKSRNGTEFALGGTAEEMFVDLTRRLNLSYRDLPFNIYQFSVKFRDELRSRGGLLRVREFIMKDAYSFDRDESEFEKEYQ